MFLKQNRVIKQLHEEKLRASKAASAPKVISNKPESAQQGMKELDKNDETTDQLKIMNSKSNCGGNSNTLVSTFEKKRDPAFRLPKPADFDDYWYKGDDGQMYNEYNDELEEGFYYEDDNLSTVTTSSQKLLVDEISGNKQLKSGKEKRKGKPRPADYEDFWYEGDDGQMYNEYDDELEEGEYYVDDEQNAVYNELANGHIVAEGKAKKPKQNGEVLLGPDPSKAAEEAAKAAAEEATKAAEEAAKAAAEASKNLLKGMSSLGGGLLGSMKTDTKTSQPTSFGFGLGGLFSNSEPQQKQKSPVKPAQMAKQEKTTSASGTLPAITSASATVSVAAPAFVTASSMTATPIPVSASLSTAPTSAEAATKEPIVDVDYGTASVEEQTSVDISKNESNIKREEISTNTSSLTAAHAEAAKIIDHSQSVTTELQVEPIQSDIKDVLTDERNRSPKTAGFNARQRWKWSYAMVKKVKQRRENCFIKLHSSS
jgi:hypothetical protein